MSRMQAALRDRPLARFAFYAVFFGVGMLVFYVVSGENDPLLWAGIAGLAFAALMTAINRFRK
jgi:uncharacterized membrane protein